MLRLGTQCNIIREVQRLSPVDNFPISVMTVLSAERRPTDEALEHDGSQRPPIAIKRVALAGEDFGGDVVRGSDSRVSHDPTGFSPVVDLRPVAHSEVDLINGDRVPISRSARLALKELLVVVVVMKLVETSRKSEIRKLDMTTSIEEDIVGFDITYISVSRGK